MIVITSTNVSDLPERGMAWLVDAETGEIRAAFYDGHMQCARPVYEGNTDPTIVL